MTASPRSSAPHGGPEPDGPGGRLVGVLLVLGGIMSFQVGGSMAKTLFPLFGPLGTVSLRLWVAAIVLCLISRPWRAAPDRGTLLIVVGYGLSIGLMNMMFYLALDRLPLGIAVAVEFLGPLTLTFLGSRRPRDMVLIAVVVLGLVLLLQPGSMLDRHGIDPVGVLYGMLGAVAWGTYILAGARISHRIDAAHGAAIGLAAGALAVTPVFVLTLPRAAAHPHAALVACGVALLSSALPYTLEMLALKRLQAREFGILTSLDPAVAALAGLVLLGEYLSPAQWAGILCIVTASVGGVLLRRPETSSAADRLEQEAIPEI
ncbi:transporter EamA [Gluconacetobacter johannae DSM 13595]|uniref:EamA family transporter n=1 Tax=Gluconacetobacter johannae TaxID=112140 RepID=A0A7W4J6V9_9PROT|nr:EamA family transporter [Gluconacetobacter johannae]MBB2175532.1 EamA family transporter [Gluconacetobacter johannae]GBQ83770.1 transporter EamA [Gluconacetobacter johannae DSM 13595]